MKKYLLLALLTPLALTTQAFDPLGAYTVAPPQGCVDKNIQTDELTLADLVQIGLCTNPSLSAQYMSVKASEAGLGMSRASYLPSVTLSGKGNITGEKIEHTPHYTQNEPYAGTASASWLLFDWGGRSARVDAIRASMEASQFGYNAALQDLMLAIQKAYLNALAAKETLTSANASLDTYKQSYTEAQKRYKLGMVSLSDKLQAQTRYEQAILAVVLAENQVKQTSGNLAVLLNLSPTTNLKIAVPEVQQQTILLENDDIEALLKEALQNRPEVRASQAKEQAAKSTLYNTRTKNLPSFTANASATYGDNWKKSSPYKTETAAGLSVSMPLFTGFANTYEMQQADYLYKASQSNTQNVQLQIQNEVWASYQNYHTAYRAYEISQTVLKSAEENERVAFRYYKVGKGDIINLLSAVAQLADARQNKIAAFYDLLLSKASLYRSIGKY